MVDYKISTDYMTMYMEAVHHCMSYLVRNPKIDTLHLGVSGGIDSAVTAALAADVCNRMIEENVRKIKLYGHSLPIDTTEAETIRAENIGHSFCDHFIEEDLEEALCGLARGIDFNLLGMYDDGVLTEHADKVRWGNMKARTRMVYLYNQAAKHNGMVLSTDNLTEYMLGFWTLHGDVGDYCFIQNLWKTEVYGLAKFIIEIHNSNRHREDIFRRIKAMQGCINAIPTDGLGVTESDFDQIFHPEWKEDVGFKGPFSPEVGPRHLYRQIDNTLIDILTGVNVMNISPIGMARDRFHATKWKRNNPYSVPRVYLT